MMVKIAISLSENKELGLPLQPLVWALAFGACLGGKSSLICQAKMEYSATNEIISHFRQWNFNRSIS